MVASSIRGTDRAGLERLLRHCARPPFALEHLHQLDTEHLIYPKPRSDSRRDLVLATQPAITTNSCRGYG